jgi:hypothetical protein
MNLLPSDDFTIQTRLAPEQICQKLSNELESSSFAAWSTLTTKKTYRGSVGENKFEITPIVFYNNFTPVIKGDIVPETEATKIKVRMLPRFYLIFFMAVSLGFLGFVFFLLLAAWIFSIGKFYVSPLGAILSVGFMFVIVYVFLVGGFAVEAAKSKERLMKLVDATEIQS